MRSPERPRGRKCRPGECQKRGPGEHGPGEHGPQADERAQLSVPLLEAALGVLLLFSVAGVFAVGVPDPGAREARLDGYAANGLETLRDGDPSLGAFVRNETGQETIENRLERLVPPGARYRLEAPSGSVGSPVPAGVPTGRARTATANGTATLWMWYG